MNLDLALVMPVYNEESCIEEVVHSWFETLSSLDISFRMIVLNDGSSDNTGKVLEKYKNNNWVHVINKPNGGHGPTILMGYKKAVGIAKWVFQCDSDNEMESRYFPELWNCRNDYDALFGTREGRQQNLARKIITLVSRLTVRIFFGKGVQDVNTPYRLIKTEYLEKIIVQIPEHTFAPNVIISGTLSKAGARILNKTVPHNQRKTGSVSIVKWSLWKAALKSFFQTLSCRPKLKIPTRISKIL